MSDFKTRLIAEKNELMEKTEKLSTFLNSENSSSVDEFQLTMLNIQLSAMQTYHGCLEARLKQL